jgi:hypothetical protein
MAGVVVVNQPAVTLYDSSGNEIAPAKETTLASLEGKDFATQTTLATRASEATLEAARLLLVALDGKDFATQTTLATRSSEATLEAARLLLVSIKNTDGIKKITDGVQLNAGTAEIGKVAQGTKAAGADAWPIALFDEDGNAIDTQLDAGVRRLEIAGKVQVTGAVPPPATTPVIIYAATPLSVGSNDTSFTIPNGETFYLQGAIAGNEDPTKGASIEIIYDNGTEHLIERVYTAGQTISIGYSDLSAARDGTALVGNGSHAIIVRREKYGGTNIAIDAVVSGYTV